MNYVTIWNYAIHRKILKRIAINAELEALVGNSCGSLIYTKKIIYKK